MKSAKIEKQNFSIFFSEHEGGAPPMAEGRCRLGEGRGREKGKENILREKNGGRSAKRSVFIEAALQNLKKKIFFGSEKGG